MSVRLTDGSEDESAPVTAEQLREYFHAAGKSPDQWRLGAEFERFAVNRATGQALTYDEPGGIRDILLVLAAQFGWTPFINQDGFVTALSRNGATVSLEPGGQVELSTAVASSVADIARQYDEHVAELRAVDPTGHIAWLCGGVHPLVTAEDIALMPRVRHRIMAEYLPQHCPTALMMMKATTSTQVTFDYADEPDAVRKFVTAIKLSPIVNAMWGNGPLYGMADTHAVSHRGHVWRHMDPARSGFLMPLLKHGFTFDRWVEYLLDVPMMLTHIGGRYAPAGGRSFRDFMADGVGGHYPTLADWEVHLTTVFPEVRLKRFLEIRGADSTPRSVALALPAFWKGLLYDPDALTAASDLANIVRPEELPSLGSLATQEGLAARYHKQPLSAWCRQFVDLAADGLQRQAQRAGGADEGPYLDPLRVILERGRSPGDEFRHAVLTGTPPDTATVIRWFDSVEGP